MKNRLVALSAAVASFLLACAGASASSSSSSSETRAVSPAAARPAAESSLRVQWLGGPTAILERAGLRVITDPMLGPRGPRAFTVARHPSTGAVDAPIARYTQTPSLDVGSLGAIVISHTHADHVDARAKEVLPKHLPLVVPPAGVASLRAAGFTDVRPLDWGESLTLPAPEGRLIIHAVPAHHAHDAKLDHDLGRGNGYVFEWEDATRRTYRIYWTGDAVLSDEMKEISRFGKIDLLVPHLGGVGGDSELGLRTMNAEETLSLVGYCDPRLVIPIHHTTFGHYREPIVALAQRAGEAAMGPRVRLLEEGETATLAQ